MAFSLHRPERPSVARKCRGKKAEKRGRSRTRRDGLRANQQSLVGGQDSGKNDSSIVRHVRGMKVRCGARIVILTDSPSAGVRARANGREEFTPGIGGV
jgi:hypothetical protein